MAIPYKKWTEEEINNRNVSEEGDYPFKIINLVMKKTKGRLDDSGQLIDVHPMVEIDFEFHDANGLVKKQKDWITFMEGMDWKFRHLASTTGLIELYDNESLDLHHLKGKLGIFKLGIKESEYKGEKRKQNFVKDYIKKETQQSLNNNNFDDDIPL